MTTMRWQIVTIIEQQSQQMSTTTKIHPYCQFEIKRSVTVIATSKTQGWSSLQLPPHNDPLSCLAIWAEERGRVWWLGRWIFSWFMEQRDQSDLFGHLYLYICVSISVNECIYLSIYTHICVYTYFYMNTHIYAYTVWINRYIVYAKLKDRKGVNVYLYGVQASLW